MTHTFARALLRLVAATLLAACSGDSDGTTIVSPETPAAPPQSEATRAQLLSLSLQIQRIDMYPFERQMLLALTTYDRTVPVPTPIQPTWTSSNPAVATVSSLGHHSGEVLAISPGTFTITATVEGKSASVTLAVVPTPGVEATILEVESFTMIEFQYPGATGRWFYAPQLRVRIRGNANGASITRLDFTIPGLGSAPSCNTYIRFSGGSTVELFPEIYGDYPYTLEQVGVRASGADARATLTLTDSNGKDRTLVLTGKIVAGSLPTTYTGGNPAWLCGRP
ncbi:MAG: Ig-like domain-containing protein [Gemmatimonas sp.]